MSVYWPNIKRSATTKVAKGGTVAEVLRLECGITSERSVEWWEEMVTKALRALTLVEDRLEMTRRLWRLLCAITEERNASHITEDKSTFPAARASSWNATSIGYWSKTAMRQASTSLK